MRFRVSIARLMVAVALAGVGLAALKHPTDLGASALFTIAAGLVCVAVLGAALGRGRRRADWAGFAVFGGAYLHLALLTPQAWPPPLLSTKLLARLEPHISPPAAPNPGPGVATWDFYPVWQVASIQGLANFPASTPGPGTVAFFQVGHSLASILAGVVGMLVGRAVARRGEEGAGPGSSSASP